MSRKQEIYREILSRVLPSIRGCLSAFRRPRLFFLLSRREQANLRSHYEVAEFAHNLYVSILEEEFTDHDIHFLNYQARAFFERNRDAHPHYSLFAYYVQELFKEVPGHLRHKLNWNGPTGDYTWACPRRGVE